jgi:predicted RNase H-like nuclease
MDALDVLGVDGTRRGWLTIRLSGGTFSGARSFEKFGDLIRAFPTAAVIGVDIPIGLPARGRRKADELARKKIRPLHNSVFFAPPRPALEAEHFAEAVEIARSLDSSLSQQAFALRSKILEVLQTLEAPPLEAGPRIVEVHPEVSFWAMNGKRSLSHPKKSWNGVMARLQLLRAHGVDLPSLIESVDKASADDVLDAAAAAWSAWRVACGQAQSLPDRPEVDQAGRPMAIWY